MPDYDDTGVDTQWCAEMRERVSSYLKREGVTHGRIGEYPAWHVAPYASVWAIESVKAPNHVGWWVISGDLPTDYVSAASIKHPREVLGAIAQRWSDAANLMLNGMTPEDFTVGSVEDYPELAPLLKTRARLLQDCVADDTVWQEAG